jgi:sugar phosphate isomerase/epimerase
MSEQARISIVTDEISRDLTEVRTFLDEHDLSTVELRCVGEGRVPDVERDDYETLRMWSWNGERSVLALSPGLFKCNISDDETIDRHLSVLMPWSVQMAVELGAKFIIAFTFDNPEELPLDGKPVEILGRAAQACDEAGIPLLIENEPGQFACSALEVKALLDAVNHENLFVNWDASNGNQYGEDDLREGLTAIFPRVRHVHVKNGHLDLGQLFARCCLLKDGAIDWVAHLRLLKTLGYDGHFGIETHFEPLAENSAIMLAQLREMLAETGFAGDA